MPGCGLRCEAWPGVGAERVLGPQPARGGAAGTTGTAGTAVVAGWVRRYRRGVDCHLKCGEIWKNHAIVQFLPPEAGGPPHRAGISLSTKLI